MVEVSELWIREHGIPVAKSKPWTVLISGKLATRANISRAWLRRRARLTRPAAFSSKKSPNRHHLPTASLGDAGI